MRNPPTCTVGVCSSPVHCRDIGRCFSASARPARTDAPAFYIEVVEGTHLGTSVARINWNCAGGFSRPLEERLRLIGRYACNRVAPIGIGVPLLPPVVEVPVELAQRVSEALCLGVVTNEDAHAFRDLVRREYRGMMGGKTR